MQANFDYKNKNKLSMKILKNLRTRSLNSKFTGSYKKVYLKNQGRRQKNFQGGEGKQEKQGQKYHR